MQEKEGASPRSPGRGAVPSTLSSLGISHDDGTLDLLHGCQMTVLGTQRLQHREYDNDGADDTAGLFRQT